jgi:hypothetical protein
MLDPVGRLTRVLPGAAGTARAGVLPGQSPRGGGQPAGGIPEMGGGHVRRGGDDDAARANPSLRPSETCCRVCECGRTEPQRKPGFRHLASSTPGRSFYVLPTGGRQKQMRPRVAESSFIITPPGRTRHASFRAHAASASTVKVSPDFHF